jgi:peroxiredoxin
MVAAKGPSLGGERMRRFLLLTLAAMTFAAVVAAPEPAAAVAVGRPAPAFQAADAEGKPVSLASLHGKTVVLEWTNNGCPYVGHMYASGVMQTLQRQAAAEGVVWLAVISSAPGKQGYLTAAGVKDWKAKVGAAPAAVILDPSGQLGQAYGAKTTPDMFVIDPAGKLVYAGAIDDNPSTDPGDAKRARNYVALALADLKEGKPVNPALTVSYGCSVKYR